MLTLIHTADWHLGHHWHGLDRLPEHQAFLDWLLQTLLDTEADVLLIAGDVFDTVNPSAEAQRLFYAFLAKAYAQNPQLQIIMIAGNHDSAARLEAAKALLDRVNVQVVGRYQTDHVADLLFPLTNKAGNVAAWCVAMPFLRTQELPNVDADETQDALIEGVRAAYVQAFEALEACREAGQRLIALGHCYMVGGEISELSERKVLGGNQHALPVDIFPKNIDYVALGHLHRAQRVAKQEHIRYSGSPLPLSFSERHYQHQVLKVNLTQQGLESVEALQVPRLLDVIRLPDSGFKSWSALQLVLQQGLAEGRWPLAEGQQKPLLELGIALEKPNPALRQEVDDFLSDYPLRLVKISLSYPGRGHSLAEVSEVERLEQWTPERVFSECYQRHYASEPERALLAAFHELLEQGEAS